MPRTSRFAAVMFVAGILGLSGAAPAAPARADAPGPTVQLPYQVTDVAGNMWMVFDAGMFRINGRMPVYQQASMLTIDGNNVQNTPSTANTDAKTGELIFDNMQFGVCTVTRRILLDKQQGVVRYVDIFKNTSGQEETLNIGIQTMLNFGVTGASNVQDPKRPANNLAWVAMTGCGRAAVDVYAGVKSKVVPNINYQQGNNQCEGDFSLTIPAGKSAALAHFHSTAASIDTGSQFAVGINAQKALADLPRDIRKLVVNFPAPGITFGDYELLRGDVFDVVELRSGDQLRGTLKESAYKLKTFYGSVELPADQVIGMINIGQFRPRQLVVTGDGQMFGGNIEKDTVSLQLSSGQVIEAPLAQISRIGYRKRPGEPEEITGEKPFALLATGDKVAVRTPTAPVEVRTRYGLLELDPRSIQSIEFRSEDSGVHTITLTDGSRFQGLATADTFQMTLAGASAPPASTEPTDANAAGAAASPTASNESTAGGASTGGATMREPGVGDAAAPAAGPPVAPVAVSPITGDGAGTAIASPSSPAPQAPVSASVGTRVPASIDTPGAPSANSTTGQIVRFSSNDLIRLQFAGKPDEPPATEGQPSLKLVNQDNLIGEISGALKLDTAFNTIRLNGPEIRHISRATASSDDVQVTLWDKTIVSGQLETPTLTCELKSGGTITAPVSMLDEYDQPFPSPSAPMIQKIKDIAANLNADDFKQREEAETQLLGIGPVVVGVLKEVRPTSAPETQSRIDGIMAKLGTGAPSTPDAAGVAAPTPSAGPLDADGPVMAQ